MNVDDVLSEAPQTLGVAGPAGRAQYELAEDLIAAHGGDDDRATVMSLEGGRVSASAAEEGDARSTGRIGPVYRQVPGGNLTIPTGRVLVRFPEGHSAADHRAELSRAGFRVEEVLSYAPHAAWVTASTERIVDALRRLDRLAAVSGVEHVEPQLISERRPRTSSD